MTLSVAPASPNAVPTRAESAPGSSSNTGATPANSFQSTYNDVQKSNQDDASNTDSQKPILAKPEKDRKDTRDLAPDPKDAPVIAQVAAPPPPPIAPLLFSLPVNVDVAPATNSSESKDGASLLPPPPTAISTDLVSAGLAQTSLDTSTVKLDIPRLPSSDTPRVPNKDLAFAIRLLSQDSTALPQTPGSSPIVGQEISAPAQEFSTPKVQTSAAISDVSGASVLTALQPASSPITTAAATEAPESAEVLPAGETSASSAVPLSAGAPETTAIATRLPTGAPQLLNKDLPIRTNGRDASTVQQGITPKSPTPEPIGSPKIAPVRQPVANGPSKGNDGSNDTPDSTTTAQKPAETNMSYPAVRDIASTKSPETSPAIEPKPLNTQIEAPAPVAKAGPASAAPVNEISVRVNGPDQSSAAIRVVDRSGEIRVSVHASDPQLTNTLRADVDQLRSHMTSRGWDAEVWTPQNTPTGAARESGNNGSPGPQDQNNSGGRRDGQGQNQSQQNPEDSGKQPAWMEEFEATVLKGGE